MPTFLTTRRMEPALAARVEMSVRGRLREPGAARRSPRLVSMIRLGLVLAVALGVSSFVSVRRREMREREQARTSLLDAVRAQGSLSAFEKGSVARAEVWLERLAGNYDNDLVSDGVRAPGAIDRLFAKDMVYVRGPFGAFKNPARIAEVAAASSKDALLLCLVAPPPSRLEKVMLGSVHMAYAGLPALEAKTANVRRLHEAIAGLPVFSPQWSERARAADDPAELARLRRELERAPLARAKQAARAELLLVAMDEPGDGGGPTELDGEREHAVRITLVDLAAEKVLLRARKRVDPAWISPQGRSQYASGLDGCRLALDVREHVSAAAAVR